MAAAILGFFGGLVGAFFIRINNFVNVLRKKFLQIKLLKIAESIVLIVITVSVMYLAVLIKYNVHPDANENKDIC